MQKFQMMMTAYNAALEAGVSKELLAQLDEEVKDSFVFKW
tara:strand:+ start:4578 stop:4697 length:120 start_codon:yes stop_codon:yes gene_type:complete